jgi:hypothetical protein
MVTVKMVTVTHGTIATGFEKQQAKTPAALLVLLMARLQTFAAEDKPSMLN